MAAWCSEELELSLPKIKKDKQYLRENITKLKSSGTLEKLEREQQAIQSAFPSKDVDDDEDEKDIVYYANIALAYYNHKHGTGYQLVGEICAFEKGIKEGNFIHCSFLAAPDECISATSVPLQFFAEFLRFGYDGKEIVLSCRILLDTEEVGCFICDAPRPPLPFGPAKFLEKEEVGEDDKLHFPRIAVAHYNKKQNVNYKAVEALAMYATVDLAFAGFVIHCNFKAEANSPHEHGSSPKLFFAELIKEKTDVWKVVACRTLGNKTTAGCHICEGAKGRKVLHPKSRFRYGLYDCYERKSPRLLAKSNVGSRIFIS